MTKVSFEVSGSNTPNAVISSNMGKDSANPETARKTGAKIFSSLKTKGQKTAVIDTGTLDANTVALIADGFLRASYTFNKYKTTPQAEGPESLTITTPTPKEAAAAFAPLKTTTESAFWASDMANEPANVLNPQTYAERVLDEMLPLGVKVRVIGAHEMKQLGMGAALAVGQGSKTPPRMVVLEYDGTNGAQKRPLALVGKGITFDSGGISLKPGAGMGDMALDMSGSAAVAGAVRALAARGAKTHVVGIMALAENMPDQNSTRPGDIVKSMSGKTVYIGNTDAEGRLVLADALAYVQKNYNPHTVVDLATLTGAAAAALGNEIAAVFANDDSLMNKFNKASAASGEQVWRLPFTEAAKKLVQKTPHADLTNNAGAPGALTAAAFLREFIDKNADGSDKRKFAHIDMAGPGTHSEKELKGWGVFLLNELISKFYEQKTTANENTPPTQAPAVSKRQPKL